MNTYKDLFIEIAKSSELLAEQVMQYDHDKNDANGEKVAEVMRDDFRQLGENLNAQQPSRNDYIKLLVGALIIRNNLQDKINAYTKAINSYATDVIPKLQRIVDETEDDIAAATLAEQLFS